MRGRFNTFSDRRARFETRPNDERQFGTVEVHYWLSSDKDERVANLLVRAYLFADGRTDGEATDSLETDEPSESEPLQQRESVTFGAIQGLPPETKRSYVTVGLEHTRADD